MSFFSSIPVPPDLLLIPVGALPPISPPYPWNLNSLYRSWVSLDHSQCSFNLCLLRHLYSFVTPTNWHKQGPHNYYTCLGPRAVNGNQRKESLPHKRWNRISKPRNTPNIIIPGACIPAQTHKYEKPRKQISYRNQKLYCNKPWGKLYG